MPEPLSDPLPQSYADTLLEMGYMDREAWAQTAPLLGPGIDGAPDLLAAALIGRGLVTEVQALRGLMMHFDVGGADLRNIDPPADQLVALRAILPGPMLWGRRIAPLRLEGSPPSLLHLGMCDPGDHATMALVQQVTRYEVKPVAITPRGHAEFLDFLLNGGAMHFLQSIDLP
jgi:hypothetical protein